MSDAPTSSSSRSQFLADENFEPAYIEAIRRTGLDIVWIAELRPGLDDGGVLALARKENRVLLTFDLDFGERVFRMGEAASCGIALFRLSVPSVEARAARIARALMARADWRNLFARIDDLSIRVRPLPST